MDFLTQGSEWLAATSAPAQRVSTTTTAATISTPPAPDAPTVTNVSGSNVVVIDYNSSIGLPSHLWGFLSAQNLQVSFRNAQFISFEGGLLLQFYGVCDCSLFGSSDWIFLNGSSNSPVSSCSIQSCSDITSFPYSIKLPQELQSAAASRYENFLQADWMLSLGPCQLRLSTRNKLLKFFITAVSNASICTQGLVNAVLLNHSSKVIDSGTSTYFRLEIRVAESTWSSWAAGEERFFILELSDSTHAALWWSTSSSFAATWDSNPTLSLQKEKTNPHTEWRVFDTCSQNRN